MASSSCARSSSGQALLHLGHHVGRQIWRQVGQFVGVHGFRRGHQVLPVHRLDQRLADPVLDFQQHVRHRVRALTSFHTASRSSLGSDSRMKRDVRRVQAVDQRFELGFVLALHQLFDQVAWRVSPSSWRCTRLATSSCRRSQFLHLGQARAGRLRGPRRRGAAGAFAQCRLRSRVYPPVAPRHPPRGGRAPFGRPRGRGYADGLSERGQRPAVAGVVRRDIDQGGFR